MHPKHVYIHFSKGYPRSIAPSGAIVPPNQYPQARMHIFILLVSIVRDENLIFLSLDNMLREHVQSLT